MKTDDESRMKDYSDDIDTLLVLVNVYKNWSLVPTKI